MLQVIGFKNNREVQRTVRYLKERSLSYALVDLGERSLSEKEWKSIINSVIDPAELIDCSSPYYKRSGLSYMEFNPIEEIILHPEVMKNPILRDKNRVCIGFSESFIKEITNCTT